MAVGNIISVVISLDVLILRIIHPHSEPLPAFCPPWWHELHGRPGGLWELWGSSGCPRVLQRGGEAWRHAVYPPKRGVLDRSERSQGRFVDTATSLFWYSSYRFGTSWKIKNNIACIYVLWNIYKYRAVMESSLDQLQLVWLPSCWTSSVSTRKDSTSTISCVKRVRARDIAPEKS